MVIKGICLTLYFFVLVGAFFLISERLKFLNKQRVQYIGEAYTSILYKKLMISTGITLIFLFLSASFIVLTIY